MIRKCEICKKRDAKYVCQECGRQICELCFDPSLWLCRDCVEKMQQSLPRIYKTSMIPYAVDGFMKILTIGFIIMFIGIILIMMATILGGGKISGGIIIFPFIPIPLIFGFGPEAIATIIIAAILMIILIILIIFTRKMHII